MEIFTRSGSAIARVSFLKFEGCRSLEGKAHFLSPLGFEVQGNYDSETSGFKRHSFRAFQLYLTDKNPTHGRGTASVFRFSARSFGAYFNRFH